MGTLVYQEVDPQIGHHLSGNEDVLVNGLLNTTARGRSRSRSVSSCSSSKIYPDYAEAKKVLFTVNTQNV